jgi:hypothetical protein
MAITEADIRGAVARAWCTPENENKVIDTDLALAASDEVYKLFLEDKTAYLGCATTLELITELQARAEVSAVVGEKWPNYRTVD